MADFGDDYSNKFTVNILKARSTSLLFAPVTSDPIEAVTETANATLLALPAGYRDAGLTTDDGPTFSRATETDAVTSHGRTEPSIEDKVSDTLTMAVTFQEANATTLSLYYGLSKASLEGFRDPTTGELFMPTPELPDDPYYRCLAISRDSDRNGRGDVYFGYFLPKVKVSEPAEQAWGKTGEVQFGVTITAFVDDALKYSRAPFYGGPGWKGRAADMGFSALT